MSIRNNKSRLGYVCLAVFGLLGASGCGDDRPMVTAARGGSHAPAVLTPVIATPAAPVTPSDADPLTPPDPLAGDTKSDAPALDAPDAAPDGLADAGTDLGATAGPKMPTQHSHWLSVSQFGARVTVRLNGVWYGEFYGSTLRDITMRLRPGPNTLTVTYAPQSDEAWLAVHVTEGEHTPPMPDLVVYRVAPLPQTNGSKTMGVLATTTRTFRFNAQ